jgi:hypothetical protein
MAYRLPPPWDSGYAIPGNVRDEGLERHAIVTKWMPRGTYDNPPVRNVSNYAIPQYVKAEGYGQGAKVTQWQPSGTYSGPKIPNWLNQRPQRTVSASGKTVSIARPSGRSGMQGMGAVPPINGGDVLAMATDDVFPEPWGSYGIKAATTILGNLQKLPANQRKPALKSVLNAVDPTLWTRTQQMTQRHIAMGKPPAQALHAGLARAMSSGIVAELHRTGKTQKYPSPNSLLGLGCYGCTGVIGALGAVEIVPSGVQQGAAAAQQSTVTASPSSGGTVYDPTVGSSPATPEGAATSDGKLIWSAGAWRIKSPNDTPTQVLDYDSSSIVASAKVDPSLPLYVGAFPFNVGATSPYVTMLTKPSQFDQRFLPTMQSMMTAAAAKGTRKNCAMDYCASWADPDLTPTTTVLTPSNYQAPQTFVTGTDSDGNPCHIATYPGNPTAFTCYSLVDWATGAGFIKTWPNPADFWSYWTQPCGVLIWGCGATETGLVQLFNCFQGTCHIMKSELSYAMAQTPADWLANLPPFGAFIHPATGQQWGLWLALVKDAGPSDAVEAEPGKIVGGTLGDPSVGAWNETSDQPFSYHFEIGFAPMATVTTWEEVLKDVLEGIFYIPGLIFTDVAAAIGVIVSTLGTLACDAVSSPTAAAGVSAAMGGAKNPATGIAVAGVAITQAICGNPNPPPPPATSNLTELLLIGGAALAAVLLLTRK